MAVVRMDISSALLWADMLDRSAGALRDARGTLAPALTQASAFLSRTGVSGQALWGIDELNAMATDVRWRAGVLEDADARMDHLGRAVGELPARSLQLIHASVDELISAVRSPELATDALRELGYRLTTPGGDPQLVLDAIHGLGRAGVVDLLAALPALVADNPAALSATMSLLVAAAASGHQPTLTLIAEAATDLHFSYQDRHLDVLERDFTILDTLGQGDPADATVSVRDLRAASQGHAGTGPELRAAAGWLLGQPGLMAWLAMGDHNQSYLSPEDPYPGVPRAAIERFRRGDIAAYRSRRNTAFVLTPLLDRMTGGDAGLSRQDVSRALLWEDLGDHQRRAVAQVLVDDAHDRPDNSALALTLAGWAPGIGDVVSAAATVHFMVEGDHLRAGEHALNAAVPGPAATRAVVRPVVRAAGSVVDEALLRGGTEVLVNAGVWALVRPASDALQGSPSRGVPAIVNRRDG